MPLCYSVPPLVQETCQDKLSEEVIPRSCIHADCNMDMPCFAVTSRRAASILLRVRSKACCCLLLNGILAWSSPSFSLGAHLVSMACFAAAMRAASICCLSRSASPFPCWSQSKLCLASARKGSSIWWLIPCHCFIVIFWYCSRSFALLDDDAF